MQFNSCWPSSIQRYLLVWWNSSMDFARRLSTVKSRGRYSSVIYIRLLTSNSVRSALPFLFLSIRCRNSLRLSSLPPIDCCRSSRKSRPTPSDGKSENSSSVSCSSPSRSERRKSRWRYRRAHNSVTSQGEVNKKQIYYRSIFLLLLIFANRRTESIIACTT